MEKAELKVAINTKRLALVTLDLGSCDGQGGARGCYKYEATFSSYP